jgi:hypothetical protein
MRRLAPVFTLFFLAPLVAEYLLGDLPIVLLPAIVAFAPMYGGGALLIREVTRRTGRGWPTMLVLGLAYGVLEEGLLTQSLFNPGYLNLHLLQNGFIPALGIGATWTVYVVLIHVLWSIATPIALVEAASGPRGRQPWLGRRGLVVTTALFLLGCGIFFAVSYGMSKHFLASPAQLISSAVIVAALVFVAFALPRGDRPGAHRDGSVPQPSVVFAVAAVAGVTFMAITSVPVGIGVPVALATLAVMVVLVGHWSAHANWGPWHLFALAAAALLTYAWHSFTFGLDGHGAVLVLNLVSRVVFVVVGLAIAGLTYRAIRWHQSDAVAGPAPEALAVAA